MAAMAQLSLLVLATCILGAFAVPTIDDPIAFKNATWEKCQKKENVPDDAMNDLYLFKSVEGIKDHKCVAKCLEEEYGAYQDGTIRKEVIQDAIRGLWKDKQTQEKLITTGDDCVDAANYDLDPCQMNYDLIDCFIQGMKKDGIKVE